ncbi:nuclear transport factor 2 family protein [uncultured Tenacibaculum sp.]|uniref:nuclear transport factor 2 family protein n=1 Tax=uncultured Tenacibaculum sp. TaxID=174713 RepID=UPI002612218F|nr:nuclear transport factor 2 family protein [uncultured Tenacibaculum sp.]
MKKLLLLFFPIISFAQLNTEVYLFDIKKKGKEWKVTNGRNISNNKAYDNQPHFYDDFTVIFSSTRNKQTDIAKYDIRTGSKTFINNTPNGGEYSPQRIPNSKNVSAVRLDKDGKQRFYEYNINTGKDKELIKDLVIAYPFWYDNNTVVSSAIVSDSLELNVSNIKTQKNTPIFKNVGRSFHKIPNSDLVSFMKKNGGRWDIWSLNPKTLETKLITSTIENQDVCWLPDGTLLIPSKNVIFKYHPKKDQGWSLFYRSTNEEINNITRITVSDDGSQIAFVAEESPRHIVQKQLEAYNKRDLKTFLSTFSDDVKVYTYLDKLNYQGKEKMKMVYGPMFKTVKDLHCKILNRIIKGNKVIDEEQVTVNGKSFKTVAIYEVNNGKITTVRFLRQ